MHDVQRQGYSTRDANYLPIKVYIGVDLLIFQDKTVPARNRPGAPLRRGIPPSPSELT